MIGCITHNRERLQIYGIPEEWATTQNLIAGNYFHHDA